MSKLRIALVGAGRRGAGAHLPVIRKLTDVYELAAICDKDEETANRWSRELGVPAYTSVRDLVRRETIDVADVVVPVDAHHAVALYLMAHGVHVIVETPIAPTLALTDMMIRGAEEHRVKLEVAENYYRAPIERLKAKVIESGVIGDVSRIYRIFYEGGYHGMNVLRTHARGNPTSIMGVGHTSPVIPITDRMLRHHERESWNMGVIDFDNGVLAIQIYSNVVHARSLGRGQTGISQIDATKGTIVGETVYVTPPEELHKGARAVALQPERVTAERDGVKVLEAIRIPDIGVAWENPFARYPLTEGQIAVADELLSIARAVRENTDPEYGAWQGRLDQEMNIAMIESGKVDRRPILFPLTKPTAYEEQIHESFKTNYGRDPEDVEGLLDVFFPRR